MTFTESSTVESLVQDLLTGGVTHHTASGPGLARRQGKVSGLGWHYHAPTDIPRQPQDVVVEGWVREALIRLNPEIAAVPDRADEVLYKLRAIVLSVRSDGLIKANEEFTAWLRGDRSMPFGPNNEHTTVRLLDFDDLENNHYVVTSQFTYRAGPMARRADLVLLVNGVPLVLIEAKTPVRQAVSWLDGALQVHDDYERNVPELLVANVFSVATEGKELMYGAIRMPVNLWGPWRGEDEATPGTLAGLTAAVNGLLRPSVVLDILAHFTLYATDKKKRRIKVVCRYQQYEAVNLIVQRVLAGRPKKGLIWHFQGSGKSLLMVFAAQKLRLQPKLGNPTVLIVSTVSTSTPRSARPSTPRTCPTWSRARAATTSSACSPRTRARSSSPPSSSSPRPTGCSTTAQTSSSWWTKPTAPRKATWASRCARRCRTPSSSA